MEIALNLSKIYSYADYLTWIDDKRRELIDGLVKLMSAPLTAHARIVSTLTAELGLCVKRNKGKCEVFVAPFDVRLPKNGETANKDIYTVVQPDICVVCDRSKIDRRGCLGAPDLIVEVLSPSSIVYDSSTKFALYERSGVREYWIADPNGPSVNVYLLQPDGKYDAGTVYDFDTESIPVHIFDGQRLDWKEIFG